MTLERLLLLEPYTPDSSECKIRGLHLCAIATDALNLVLGSLGLIPHVICIFQALFSSFHQKRASKESEETTSVFSHESPIFIVTLFCLLGIGGCLFVGGLFIQFIVFRRKKKPAAKDKGYPQFLLFRLNAGLVQASHPIQDIYRPGLSISACSLIRKGRLKF